jgi:hypothetical protein
MVTEDGLRLWSPTTGVPLVMLLLFTMAGPPPTDGTAGGAAGLPFTGDAELEFAWWLGAGAPTAARGLLFTMVGGFPFVAAAVAYEERALDVVPEAADGAAGEADCAWTGVGTGGAVLVIR